MHIPTAAAKHSDSLVVAQHAVGTEDMRDPTLARVCRRWIRSGAAAGL